LRQVALSHRAARQERRGRWDHRRVAWQVRDRRRVTAARRRRQQHPRSAGDYRHLERARGQSTGCQTVILPALRQADHANNEGAHMSDAATQNDWTKPAALAIPKEGFFKLEQGRYGPIYPKTPACYGFTIIAKIIPGREATIREYGKTIEKTIAGL